MKEIWKDIAGYEGAYQVSNLGNVRSVNRIIRDTIGRTRHLKGKTLHPKQNPRSGYLVVGLSDDTKYVHRLVAEAFINNPQNLPEVNHKDETRTNNVVSNLEWCDRQYNHDYGDRTAKEAQTKSKAVAQLTLTGTLITTYQNAIEASKATGANRRQIQMVASGYVHKDKRGKTIRYLTAGGYKWKYVEDIKNN